MTVGFTTLWKLNQFILFNLIRKQWNVWCHNSIISSKRRSLASFTFWAVPPQVCNRSRGRSSQRMPPYKTWRHTARNLASRWTVPSRTKCSLPRPPSARRPSPWRMWRGKTTAATFVPSMPSPVAPNNSRPAWKFKVIAWTSSQRAPAVVKADSHW